MNQSTVRMRWGVQHDFSPETPAWGTLGTGWIDTEHNTPPYVDFWPASFQTRREARDAVRALTTRSQRHSNGWRFRVVRLRITVEEVSQSRR